MRKVKIFATVASVMLGFMFFATAQVMAATAEEDCGLRVFDGTTALQIACESTASAPTSPLQIIKNGVARGIILVDITDPDATPARIQTAAGLKALKALSTAPFTCNTANKIIASDGEKDDQFGRDVSISGDYAVAGAPLEATKGTQAGAAYIFKRNSSNGQFQQIQKIIADDTKAFDGFGNSLEVSGDYAIIGAPTINGVGAGAAYVFKRNSSSDQWEQVNKLMASDAQAGDYFGQSISISGDYAIIGAYGEDTKGSLAGAAYVFKRNSSNGQWEQVNKLMASDAQAGDHFGGSISIDGDYAIIGANHENTKGAEAGAAYVFKRNSSNGQFQQIQKIMANDANGAEFFGMSISIDGNYAVISADHEDAGGANRGAAYFFKRNTTTDQFEQIQKIVPSDLEPWDEFGSSVAINGDNAIVGALPVDAGAGAAYLFQRNSATDQFEKVIKISGSELGAGYFGSSISIDEDYAIVGANKGVGAAYIIKLCGNPTLD